MEKEQSKKKTRQTRQSSKDDKTKKIESEIDGTVNIGEHITYDVLRMILEYSNIRDLAKAAMVCRSWNEAANTEIQTRIRPQHIIHKFDPAQHGNQSTKTFTDQLFIKPSIGLLFIGKQSLFVEDCLCRNMPDETTYITVWNYGIIYDNLELDGDVMSGLFLPKIPGVKIKHFLMGTQEIEQFRKTRHQSNRVKLARKFCKISPNEDNIKCVIMFANQEHEAPDECSDEAKQMLKTFLKNRTNNEENKIAIWGGIASRLSVCSCTRQGKSCDRNPLLAGISICGSGVSTWSIVLDSCVKTKAQVEKELTSFREAVKLQKYNVGFMFACCGRGEEWYAEKNVEPKIFRKVFPNVPLVGSFGDGEFGVTTIPQGT